MLPDDLYPPSPPEAREPLEPTTQYRLRVALVLVSLLLFLAIYLALVAASGWLVYWSFSLLGEKRGLSLWTILLGLGSAMLFLFFVKGLFRRSQPDTTRYVEVTEQDQPRLFAFVRRLCADAGTPFPRAIYLSHEVNAAVFYPRSLLSLIWPVRKNLLVGLGLLNLLNLSELKAVLAHEFGHFAQSSMKLGQYVYVANQVIRDLVFSRDSWDQWLARWRSIDLRLSFPAWILTGVVWLLRKALALIFRAVNLANLSLSRQMEFNADLNAARLTGSDALISGLWKTERGGLAMQRALGRLRSLAEHEKYTRDLFFHQARELGRLDKLLDAQKELPPFLRSLRAPYRYGPAIHFKEGDDHAPEMWSTHPANRERELNAKRRYLKVEPVTTPAWELIEEPKRLRKKLTLIAYDELFGVRVRAKDTLPPREVDALTREEEEERKQADHYHGFYEDRIVELGDLDELIRPLEGEGAPALEALRDEAAAWRGERLEAFMERQRRVQEDCELLDGIAGAGDKAPKTFEMRGKTRRRDEAARMLKSAVNEAEALRVEMRGGDRAIFRYFYRLAASDPAARQELLRRYRFLLDVQELILSLKPWERELGAVMRVLQTQPELKQEQFQAVVGALHGAGQALERVEERSWKLAMPKLLQLEEGASVGSFVAPEPVVDPVPVADRIGGPELITFFKQFGQILGRLRKLHFKNLGVLLRLQERLDPALVGAEAEAGAEADAEAEAEAG